MNVLLIEDDPILAKAVQRGLHEIGHLCEWSASGIEGQVLAGKQQFDAIVLDLNLPDLNGLELLKNARKAGIQTPIVIVTALGSVEERVTGLNAGADDYLVKPFEFPELIARLVAVTRRSLNLNSRLLQVGPLTLDLTTRCLIREGKEIDLTPTEFSLLELFMRNAGQVLTRKMLCTHLWDESWEGVTNVIEVHINRLRQKVDKNFEKPVIFTIRNRGYVLRI